MKFWLLLLLPLAVTQTTPAIQPTPVPDHGGMLECAYGSWRYGDKICSGMVCAGKPVGKVACFPPVVK